MPVSQGFVSGERCNGCRVKRGTAMASLYTQNADRKRLARQAINKLQNESETNCAAPSQKVRRLSRKAQ